MRDPFLYGDLPEEVTANSLSDYSVAGGICSGCPHEWVGGALACQQCPKMGYTPKPDEICHESNELHECPICGTLIFDRANKIYCSKKCRKKAYRLRFKANGHAKFAPRKCEECGTEFIPHTNEQKTCSPTCSAKRFIRVYRKSKKAKAKPASSKAFWTKWRRDMQCSLFPDGWLAERHHAHHEPTPKSKPQPPKMTQFSLI